MEVAVTNDKIELVDRIDVGSYIFKIVDKSSIHEGRIYCRRFTITNEFAENETTDGEYFESIEVVVSYRERHPVYAKINYGEDYAIDTHVDDGKFSVILRNTLFKYVHTKIPSITEICVRDTTSFESALDIELRKTDVNRFVKPIEFYYFSIAFNGKTWYEHQFRARLRNPEKHAIYRKKVDWFLHSKELKSSMDYTSFLHIDSTSFLQFNDEPFAIIDELERYYKDVSSITFGDFFQSIPEKDRCRLVGGWVNKVVLHFLDDAFTNEDWVIDIPTQITIVARNNEHYYCPKGRIWNTPWYRDFGVRPEDV